MYDIAKYSYYIATCHRSASYFFAKLVKRFEKDKVFAMRYGYEIWIQLTPSKQYNTLDLSEISVHHDNIDRFNYMKIDKVHQLSIRNRYHKHKNLHHVESIAHIILHYLDSGYKYVIFPMTIDYGMNLSYVHQGCILVDLVNKEFIFYEPYGLYSKLGRSYRHALSHVANIFVDVLPRQYSTDTVGTSSRASSGTSSRASSGIFSRESSRAHRIAKVRFWHEAKLGVQEHIRVFNNAHSNELLEQLPSCVVSTDDDLTECVFGAFRNDSKYISLFYRYSSKLCVTITLVELYLLGLDSTLNVTNNLQSFHDQLRNYRGDVINEIIFRVFENMTLDIWPTYQEDIPELCD